MGGQRLGHGLLLTFSNKEYIYNLPLCICGHKERLGNRLAGLLDICWCVGGTLSEHAMAQLGKMESVGSW